MSIVCIIIILPLAFFHKLKWLGFTSFLSIFSVAYTVSFVSIRGIMHLYTVGIGKDVKILVNPSWEFFVTLPLFCFAFQCHIHASPIYYELKNKSLKKMSFIIVTSMFICFMIYSLVGVFGYLTFGNKIKGNIMGYYDLKDVFVTIGLLCIGVTVVLSYPIHSLTARQAIESLIFPEGLHGIYYVIITLAIVFGSLGFALVIPGILQIFGLMGSIGSVSLMFIFPGLILWKLGDRWFWRILSVVLIIFGIAMGISGTAFTIMEMIIK
jgi:amino acid permease